MRVHPQRIKIWFIPLAILTILGLTGSAVPTQSPSTSPDGADSVDQDVLVDVNLNMAPAFHDGQWRLMLQEHQENPVPATPGNTADKAPVFYEPAHTAIEVGGNHQRTAHSFNTGTLLDEAPENPFWVLEPYQPDPSAETAVPGLGLVANSTETLLSATERVTFILTGFQGPGNMIAYIRPGLLGEPQPIWNSQEPFPQPHAHTVGEHQPVGWLFTHPGTYLAQFSLQGELLDGSRFVDTQLIRITVGEESATEAFHQTWSGTPPQQAFHPGHSPKHHLAADGTDWMVVGTATLLGLMLLVGLFTGLQALAQHRRRRFAHRHDYDNPEEIMSKGTP